MADVLPIANIISFSVRSPVILGLNVDVCTILAPLVDRLTRHTSHLGTHQNFFAGLSVDDNFHAGTLLGICDRHYGGGTLWDSLWERQSVHELGLKRREPTHHKERRP